MKYGNEMGFTEHTSLDALVWVKGSTQHKQDGFRLKLQKSGATTIAREERMNHGHEYYHWRYFAAISEVPTEPIAETK